MTGLLVVAVTVTTVPACSEPVEVFAPTVTIAAATTPLADILFGIEPVDVILITSPLYVPVAKPAFKRV